MNKDIAAILERLEQKYGEPIGVGNTRIVFDTGRFVIKVPRHEQCFYANYYEAAYGYRTNKNRNYAYCRLIHWRFVPVLWMEKVSIVEDLDYDQFPDWVGSIDCGQVGYARDGRLVAYDYGDNKHRVRHPLALARGL